MMHNHFNWHIVNPDLAIASIHKNASCAMLEAFKTHPRHPDYAYDCIVRLAWIRHPFTRLISAYSYLTTTDYLPKHATGNWSDFIDYTLEFYDPHWVPQIEWLTFKKKFIPTKLEKFENIQNNWFKYTTHTLSYINLSDKKPVFPYRVEDLCSKYEDDIIMWEQIDNDPVPHDYADFFTT